MSSTKKQQAKRLHQQGVDLRAAGDEAGALEKYRAALELDPLRPETLYNVGLIYKYRLDWQQSFSFNKAAYDLDPKDEATAWNLAIAATALRDWKTARSVWNGLGMKIALGDSALEEDFGQTPVRLDPDHDGEVVWGTRIDPVRVRIENIPLAQSGFRYHDVVLHDGASMGERTHAGRKYHVFNVLEPFERSGYGTFEADLVAPAQEDIAALEALCKQARLEFEDWTRNIRNLCRACSEGSPHEVHDGDGGAAPWKAERRIAFASLRPSLVTAVIDSWRDAQRQVKSCEQTLAAALPSR